jgi:type VI secretion system protein ImpM
MRRGLFGKLQSKRDFIAPGAPREFLAAWEPWLQSAVAASRAELGDGWRDAYLKMPIWRFWLGAEICGTAALGAIMPSMDGVGRYFPLNIVFLAEEPQEAPPPELEPNEAWFSAVEEFLLATLEPQFTYESALTAFQALPDPAKLQAPGEAVLTHRGSLATEVNDADFSGAFSNLRLSEGARAHAASSYWWTSGGVGYPHIAVAAWRLPEPTVFSSMICGRLERARNASGA